MMPKFTHKGWFLWCPVYIADLDSEAPVLQERHWSLMPWFAINEALLCLCIFVRSTMDPEWEPMWPIKVTGEMP